MGVVPRTRVVLMDGAMGTELQHAGLPPGTPGETWNLTRPDQVRAIHAAYVRAGATCLLTHTFQANAVALRRHGIAPEELLPILQAASANARAAAPANALLLADIGPIVHGVDEAEFPKHELLDVVHGLETTDAVLLETCSRWDALNAAAGTAST